MTLKPPTILPSTNDVFVQPVVLVPGISHVEVVNELQSDLGCLDELEELWGVVEVAVARAAHRLGGEQVEGDVSLRVGDSFTGMETQEVIDVSVILIHHQLVTISTANPIAPMFYSCHHSYTGR